MLDTITTNFLIMAISVGEVKLSVHNNFDLDQLGNMFIPWGKVTVSEIASGKKISEHEWDRKQAKFNFFKDRILKCKFFDTTIFVVTKGENFQLLIIDGVHRAIGIQKALIENSDLKDTINLRVLLIESSNMSRLPDYQVIL
ncbi:hypothetical protein AUK11_00785 [bacterium CG2_30_37_16]|nr:MAG: hypothetical protein AUK11_00785 [bacterium CG2_30_37_16]